MKILGLKSAFESMKRGGYVVSPWESYLLTKQEEDNDRRLNINAPSSIGGCLRSRYYSRMGYGKEKFSARTQRIFDNGSSVHLRIQNDLYHAGILIMDEIPVFDNSYLIQGHTDGIIHLSGKEIGVLEIKSINSRGFSELHSEKEEHRYQGLCYLHCLEKHRVYLREKYKTKGNFLLSRNSRRKFYASMYDHLKSGSKFTKDEKVEFQVKLHMKLDNLLWECSIPITKVVFLYENKDTQDLKEYVVSTRDNGAKEIIDTILSECAYLNKCVSTKVLPPRCEGAKKSSNVCRWCNFKDECFVV